MAGALETEGVPARERQELTTVLAETVQEMVAQESEKLLFPKRNALIEEKGEGKNGTHPRSLETAWGLATLHVPRDRKACVGCPFCSLRVKTRGPGGLCDLGIARYSVGVSARKMWRETVGDLLGHRCSHAAVSRFTDGG